MYAHARRAAAAVAALLAISFTGARARAEDLPSPLPLGDLLRAIRSHSPELRERRKLADAGTARPRAVRPEDPVAMLEWWQQPVDFSMVPIMLTLRQPLPYLKKLRLKREQAEREARVLGDEADETLRRIFSQAKRDYWELALAEGTLAILEKVRAIDDNLVRISEARYRAGKTVQADLFKAQSELLEIENERLDTERNRDQAIARLNGLLDRTADAPLGPTVSTVHLIAVPPASELVPRALTGRPEVRRVLDMKAAAESRLELARRENWPELAIWAGYMADFRGTNTFTIGLQSALPIFSTQRKRALTEAAQAELDAARAALAAVRRKTEVEVQSALYAIDISARHVRLHADKLIPLADLTLESAIASYQADRIDFPAVLESARGVRVHHLNHLKFLIEHCRRIADLEQAVGASLDGIGE